VLQLADEAQQAVHDRGLLAACDVMVLRALELLGKRIVRVDRSRFGQMSGLEFYEAHCRWQPDADMLDRALSSAWTFVDQVVASHAAPGISAREVQLVLDRYVRDLVKGMRVHQVEELEYRLGAFT
jgi:hypothetical protein